MADRLSATAGRARGDPLECGVIHTRTIEDTAHGRYHSGRTAQIVDGLAEIPDILGYHVLVQIARFPGPGPVRPLGFGHGWHDDDVFVRLTNAAQLVQEGCILRALVGVEDEDLVARLVMG